MLSQFVKWQEGLQVERSVEQSAAIDDIRQMVVGGCSAEEFAALRYPMCGAGLRLASCPRPNGAALVFVACDTSTVQWGSPIRQPSCRCGGRLTDRVDGSSSSPDAELGFWRRRGMIRF